MSEQWLPVETSKVTLASEILELTEQLAAHAHGVWARQRMADGWTYGPHRNDEAKQHPGLVPYAQLTESEKQYDRNAALETLKVIQALGYRIVGPGSITTDCARVLAQLQKAQATAAELLPLWQTRQKTLPVWQQPETYASLARHLIGCGLNFTAQEVALAGLDWAAGETELKLRHLKGLALARCGHLEAAARELNDPALASLPRDEEMRGLEANVEKQLGLQARTADERRKHLQRARELYHAAWKAADGTYWTGINVASLHLLLGDQNAAADVARQVEQACLRDDAARNGQPDDDPYWRLATLGEACLNQRQLEQAEKWYRQAAAEDVSRGRSGCLHATRRQLRMLLAAIGENQSLVDEWLPIPGVALFAGHRVDTPDRRAPRFPAVQEGAIRETIRQWLIAHRIRSGVSSAANGADILFLEALQSLEGSDTRIVLPFSRTEFIEHSVRNGADDSWVARFETVWKKASRTHIASTDRIGGDWSIFDYANRVILGQGLMLAGELQTSLRGLALWDGQPGDGSGGTADAVERWREQNLTTYIIHPSGSSTAPSAARAATLPVRCEGPECERDLKRASSRTRPTDQTATPVMAMLFADAKGFSGLSDGEVVKFLDRFLTLVADCVEKHSRQSGEAADPWSDTEIPVRETWGDGLYFAIHDVRTAGLFALDLCEAIETTHWQRDVGLSREMQIRIALHCGPVHLGRDPVTGLPKCTGTHVSRAARLEPSTPPNHVYASDAFAALAAERHITEFTCEFAKLLDWAKDHGTYPTYVVRRGVSNERCAGNDQSGS